MAPREDNCQIFIVDEASDLPIWVQLRNRMARLIKTGHFKPGEQLPSVRTVAAESKINYNTVTKAYRDLETSGLIISIRGRGMYVRKDLATESSEEEAAVDALVEDCVRQYRALGMTFAETSSRIEALLRSIESQAVDAMKEKREYYAE